MNNSVDLENEPVKNTGLKRDTIDKFYTKPEVVDLCIEKIKKTIKIDKNDLIIEPSAGNGSFIPGIKSISSKHIFYDIKPENHEIIKQNFLDLDYSFLKNYSNIHVVGNPPFGRQSSLAIGFIKKSCEFCISLSFILPKSFKKDSLKKHFPLNFHLDYEIDLPENSLLVDNHEYNVPCLFQIWQKKDIHRNVIERLFPINFKFVKKTENPDIAIRRVGVNAGTIYTEFEKNSIQSHYFLKFTNDKTIAENVAGLSTITYEFNNTVGPKSISKQELILKINPIMQN